MLLAFSVFATEDLEEGLYLFFFMAVLIMSLGYSTGKKTQKIIEEVGEKKYEETNQQLAFVNIIESELLLKNSKEKYHLNPPNKDFTGKVKHFWDQAKKKIRYELVFKNGQEDGVWRGWYSNGELGYQKEYKVQGFLGLGKVHGRTQVWDKSGKLLATLIYKNGNLIYKK